MNPLPNRPKRSIHLSSLGRGLYSEIDSFSLDNCPNGRRASVRINQINRYLIIEEQDVCQCIPVVTNRQFLYSQVNIRTGMKLGWMNKRAKNPDPAHTISLTQ